MTFAACYDLTLECDGEGCTAGGYGRHAVATYNAEHGSTCRKWARRAGWKMLADGLCLCPSCVKRGAKAVE